MPTIPNYVCTACGRGFTAARSARRHAANVESGFGEIVTEADYRIGLQTGRIPPPITKQIHSQQGKKLCLVDIAKEEFLRGYYHRLGEKFCELSPDVSNQLMILKLLQETGVASDVDQFFTNMSENLKGTTK